MSLPPVERPWKDIAWFVLDEAGVVFERDLVRVPYKLPDGTVHLWRIFARSGRCWWSPAGRELVPLGLELLAADADDRALFVCEGESDLFAVREAFADVADSDISGYDGIAIPGAGVWKDEWRAYLDRYSLIYVLGDGDDAGRRMTEAVCRSVPWAQPVSLPAGEDVRSILQGQGPRALDPLLREADWLANLSLAFQVCGTYDECVAFLSGGGRRGR